MPSEQPDLPLSTFVETTTSLQLEAWQHILCARLERLVHETGQRVLIHGPPQFGKSIIISQRFPAYALGVRPTARMRVACYNVTHAERFSAVVLDLMRDPQYISLFPDPACRVPRVARREEWSTDGRAQVRDANPSMLAIGLGTGFTGLGVDTLIIDDPYKNAQEARSSAHNVMLWDWWQQVVLSRLNPDANVVVMFHRWWEGDFAGKLLEQGGWELLRFPALADGLPGDPTERELGEPLSGRYPAEYLLNQRRLMGTAFEALFQGTPYPAEGTMFKAGKVGFVDAPPRGVIRRVRRWDIAASSGKGDYTVGVLMSYSDAGRFTVEDVRRGQWATDERDAIIRETAEADNAGYHSILTILPQDPGQAGVDQALHFTRLLRGFTVETERESGDKVTRADPYASQWNGGNVDLVRASWNQPYLEEVLAFPNGKYDDQVDPSAGCIPHLATPAPGKPATSAPRPAVSMPRTVARGGIR